jgi:hypothetical protein
MFVITLRGSRRRADVLAEFERVGLEVEVVVRERDVEDGKRGCFESHQRVMQLALARGLESFVVFEDDVVFRQRSHALPIRGIVEETIDFVRQNPQTMVGLGGIATSAIGNPCSTETTWIRSTTFAYTHGYAVSSSVAREISNLNYVGIHIDQVFIKKFQENMALVVPTIAFQRGYLFTPTTTDSSVFYRLLTILRNMVSATLFQISMEYTCRAWGAGSRLLGRRS